MVPILAGVIPDEGLVPPSVGSSGGILNPEGAFFVVEVVVFAVKDPRPLWEKWLVPLSKVQVGSDWLKTWGLVRQN